MGVIDLEKSRGGGLGQVKMENEMVEEEEREGAQWKEDFGGVGARLRRRSDRQRGYGGCDFGFSPFSPAEIRRCMRNSLGNLHLLPFLNGLCVLRLK